MVSVLNAMVSMSQVLMAELKKLQALLQALGVKIEALWLPSAVNRFADSLPRTWDPQKPLGESCHGPGTSLHR